MVPMTVRENQHALEELILAPCAMRSAQTRGRREPLRPDDLRTDFQRDRDRILHCNAFRRLKHKTQVFLSPQGDHYRTRLTHTLEVSQIARTVARALRLNEDLTEAIALGHDLGHTPFGHAGERALDAIRRGGFRHNIQSVRVVDHLENEGRGLNLTWEVKNGIACHSESCPPAATLEGQIVCISDKVAYINHDIEDAVRAGVLREDQLPYDCLYILGRTKSARITTILYSIVANSRVDEPGHGVIRMDEEVLGAHRRLRDYMFEAIYTNPIAKGEEGKAEGVVRTLYEYFLQHPDKLPEDYRPIAARFGTENAVCDYVAGMTDQYAVGLYGELFIPRSWPK